MDRVLNFLTDPSGAFSLLLAAEWCALAVLSFFCYLRERKSAFAAAALAFLTFGLSQFLSSSHLIASVGLFAPGSWTTRFLQIETSNWLRRLAEPSFLIFFGLLVWLNRSFEARARRGVKSAVLVLFIVWGLESLLLIPEIGAHFEHDPLVTIFHGLCSEAVLVALLFGFWLGPLGGAVEESPVADGGEKELLYAICSLTLLFGTVALWRNIAGVHPIRLSAVHYYSWFPENWVAGIAGEHFEPQVLPELGKYNSDDETVFSRHLDWFDEAGIKTILFDWWPRNPAVRKRRDRAIELLRGREINFALHYESLALKEVKGQPVVGEGINDVYLTPERSAALVKDFLRIAQTYMAKPNYLRVNDRPILFIYASRHLVGPVAETMLSARRAVRNATGLELYLVGDEVYFQVIDYSKSKGVFLLPEGIPNWSRLTAFDAIGCYNPYDASRIEHGGTAGAERFLEDVSALYRHYRKLATLSGVDFFPGLIPGYNDRGVRLSENHFVVPRVYAVKGERKNFFSEGLKRWIKPFLTGGRIELFTITSWNEWNEGTQIEPSSAGEGSGGLKDGELPYSGAEELAPYENKYLELLSDFLNPDPPRNPQ